MGDGGRPPAVYHGRDRAMKPGAKRVSASAKGHRALSGLADDDHSQYFRLAGRLGGQIAVGGTGADEGLTLDSTLHAFKGGVYIASGNNLKIVDGKLTIIDVSLSR